MKYAGCKKFTLLFFVVFFVVAISKVTGQNYGVENSPRWRFGGGVGLNFGNNFFIGSLSPSAIYQFDSNLALGFGATGAYSKSRDRYSSTILGGSVLGLYNIIPEIQISAEFEELHVNRDYEYDGANRKDNYWYPALFLGAGFHSRNVTVGIRYDVLYEKGKSIYANAYMPFVRVYF